MIVDTNIKSSGIQYPTHICIFLFDGQYDMPAARRISDLGWHATGPQITPKVSQSAPNGPKSDRRGVFGAFWATLGTLGGLLSAVGGDLGGPEGAKRGQLGANLGAKGWQNEPQGSLREAN